MAVLVSDIRAAAPEFAATPSDPVIQSAIDEAQAFVAPRAWGSRTDIGVKYLSLHILTMQGRLADTSGGGTGGGVLSQGPVTWRADETLQVGFAAPAAVSSTGGGSGFDAWLSQTGYGQQYLFFSARIFAPRVLLP